MRLYALYNRNRWILFVVMLEVGAALSVACVSATLRDSDTCASMSVVGSHPNIASRIIYEDTNAVSPALLSGARLLNQHH